MTDIEFLDPGPWQPPEPAPVSAPRQPGMSRLPLFAPPVLWTAAAVLALVAPFRTLYALTVHVPGGFAPDPGERADGWGRVHVTGAGAQAEHAVPYGIVDCVAAVLLLAAAGAALIAVVSRLRAGPAGTRARLCAAGLGIAATALLAGVAATALLSVRTLHENVTQSLQPPDHTAVIATFGIRIGWMVWLTVIAVACGLLAVVLQALPQRAPGPAVPAQPPYAAPGAYPADPDPGPDDELLDTHPKR